MPTNFHSATQEHRPLPSNALFTDMLDVLFRRRLLIAVVTLIGLCVGIVFTLKPRRYTAEGELRIEPGSASMYRTSPMSLLSGDTSNKIASEIEILQSRSLYLRVAKELALTNNPAFWGKTSIKPRTLDDPKNREEVVRQMRKVITIGHNPKDEIVLLGCTTIEPNLSAKIVNTLINDYVVHLFEMRLGSTQRTSKWLTSQLDDLKRQIESDQGEITELQKKLGVIGFDEKNSDYLQTEALNSLTKASNDAMIARILSEAKLRYLKDSDPNLVEGEVNLMTQGGPSSQQNSLLQNLRNQQAQVASAYASLLSQFGPNYPEVKQTKAQLSEITLEVSAEEERILNQANLSYRAASANEAMAKDALKQETSKTFSAHNDLVRYVLLLHDYQSHRTLYEALVEKLREAGITSGLEAAEVDVVDLADLPAIPNPPGPVLQLLGGIGIGLIFGSLCAFLLERLDSRISSADQAERVADIPLLATIPRMIRKTLNAAPGERRTDSITNPGTRYAEALQVLRSSILLARPGAPPKRILITSAVPTEGKSTTAINLAATFARHRARTILIDADLRRGVQDKRLGLEGSAGVTNVLTGSVTLEDAIQQVPDHESLFFLQAGPHPPDAAVLTASAEMASLIEMCSQRFDFVIIDTPPILGISDTIHLGQLAEVAILVVREQFSTRNAVRSAIARLKNSNIPLLGFALNNVDLSAHAYSYAYKSYYNGYYTDSKEDGQ